MKRYTKKILVFLSTCAAMSLNMPDSEINKLLAYILVLAVLGVLIFLSKEKILEDILQIKNNMCFIVTLIVCITFGCNFYYNWHASPRILNVSLDLGISGDMIALIMACFGVAAAIPITNLIISDFAHIIKENITNSHSIENDKRALSMKQACLILFIIFTIAISAIIRADYNYIDDMIRVKEGNVQFENFSRFASNALSLLIYTNTKLTDISPLSQLMAVLILAISGVIILYVIYERKTFTIVELIAVIPMGINPYFLQCLSFKFDSPYMAMSILASVFPLLMKNNTAWKYILCVVLGTVLMCTTYQAASGIFPILVIIIALRMWLKADDWKNIINFIIKSIAGYSIGILYFRQVLMLPSKVDYVSASLPSLRDFIPNFIRNVDTYYFTIREDFPNLWKYVIILTAILFVVVTLSQTSRNKYIAILVILLSLRVMTLLCFGLYPALTLPLYEVRAMYGFGVFVALLCVSVAERQKNQKILLKVPVFLISWMFFTFSFTYGNALYNQKEYMDFRTTQVISDLNDMEEFSNNEVKAVQIKGTIGFSPVVERMIEQYGILERLVPVMFCEGWNRGLAGFYNYYDMKNVVRADDIYSDMSGLQKITDNMYHRIYSDGHNILIYLK